MTEYKFVSGEILESKNFEGGYNVSVESDGPITQAVRSTIENDTGKRVTFLHALNSRDMKTSTFRAWRIFSHMKSLTNAQCAGFLKEKSTNKENKKKGSKQ